MSEDADDDPQLKSLRAVWLSMPDEEPPERGLAELMAAARIKADEMAKPSLWQRITALLRRPPVLALATVLVLIGGAVFIGQRKDKMAAEPTLTTEQARDYAQPSAGSAATVTAPEAPLSQQAPAMPTPTEAAPAPDPDPEAATKPLAKAEPKTVVKVEPKKPAPPREKPSRQPAKIEGNTIGRGAGTKSSDDSVRFDLTDGVDGRAAGEKAKLEEKELASDSFAAPEAKTAAEAPQSGAVSTADRAPQPAPSRAPQYVAQAKSAAARGNCTTARTMMKQVEKEDAAVYRKALASDAALRKCVGVAAQ